MLSDGTVSLTAAEHVLVLEALTLAKALALDMGADDHRDDVDLAEVRLLTLVERLDAMGLGS